MRNNAKKILLDSFFLLLFSSSLKVQYNYGSLMKMSHMCVTIAFTLDSILIFLCLVVEFAYILRVGILRTFYMAPSLTCASDFRCTLHTACIALQQLLESIESKRNIHKQILADEIDVIYMLKIIAKFHEFL